MRIAFESSANITGGNPDLNDEIFIYDRLTDIFTQITDEPAGGSDDSGDPSVNADGTRIAFFGDANINGGNPQGDRQVWLAVCMGPSRPIPTLSEWGLIIMTGVLGIVGFMVMRRRKVAA